MGRNLPVLPFEIKKDNEFLSRRGKFSPQIKFIEDRVDEFKGVSTDLFRVSYNNSDKILNDSYYHDI